MCGKYLQSYNFCVLGSASVIHNDVENKCEFAIFANGSIAKILSYSFRIIILSENNVYNVVNIIHISYSLIGEVVRSIVGWLGLVAVQWSSRCLHMTPSHSLITVAVGRRRLYQLTSGTWQQRRRLQKSTSVRTSSLSGQKSKYLAHM